MDDEDDIAPVENALIEDEPATGIERLMEFAKAQGDISDLLSSQELTELGAQVVEDWRRDDASRAEWKEKVETALKVAAQEKAEDKTYPWDKASNVKYPILTVASQQFAARAYPAIVKGDEAVGVKVLGDPPATPQLPPPDQVPPEQAQEVMAIAQAAMEAHQRWEAKLARAKRLKEYLNYVIFYGMDDWEGDTDALLNQIPVTGCGFRKVYYDASKGRSCSEFVNALNLTVAMDAKSMKRAPRITQDFELYPYEIAQRQRTGIYRDVELGEDEDDQKPRQVLEQHRLHDLDGDGVEEPYIVTVDVETSEVLRIDAAYGMNDVDMDPETGTVLSIKRWVPYVKYAFLPDLKGRFYDIGFGHLLGPLTAVIDTTINQLLDAGHASVAGGGFIAGGLRLQGSGQTASLKFRPGEYKVVQGSAQDIRAAIFDRTIPQPSPVLFQLLDLILGAAKEVASIKDVLTGDAPSTAPVGTTLALIEQGLQSFTAIYKRIYRALKEEFRLLYECEARYGDPKAYAEVLDDPAADFKADFASDGKDVVPVSDPTVVTKAQALAKAQVITQVATTFQGVIDPRKAALRVLEAADVDDAEDLMAQAAPPPPGMAEKAALDVAKTQETQAKTARVVAETGLMIGDASVTGGMGGLEGAPGDPMGAGGPPQPSRVAAPGMA